MMTNYLPPEEQAELQRILKEAEETHLHHHLPKMLFTWSEACWVTGLSESTLKRLVKDGQLKVSRIRGCSRFRREDLDQLALEGLR